MDEGRGQRNDSEEDLKKPCARIQNKTEMRDLRNAWCKRCEQQSFARSEQAPASCRYCSETPSSERQSVAPIVFAFSLPRPPVVAGTCK